MLSFERYFQDLFDDKNITVPRLIAFSKSHLAKLESNNPGGIYDSIITATQGKLSDLKTSTGDEGSNEGWRKGAVAAKNEARLMTKNYMVQKEGLIKSTFGKRSAEYKEFFPKGINLFRHSTDGDMQTILKIAVSKAQKYVAQLGNDFLTELSALSDNYSDALKAATGTKGGVSAGKRRQYDARQALQRQLCINLCTVAIHNMGHPERADDYFEAHLLFPAKRHRLFKGRVAAGDSKEVCTFKYAEGKRFHIMVTGAGPLQFQMSLRGNPVGRQVTVQPREKFNESFGHLSSAGEALVVTNPEQNEGRYMVWEVA